MPAAAREFALVAASSHRRGNDGPAHAHRAAAAAVPQAPEERVRRPRASGAPRKSLRNSARGRYLGAS